jgi:RNA processing factor Prp31
MKEWMEFIDPEALKYIQNGYNVEDPILDPISLNQERTSDDMSEEEFRSKIDKVFEEHKTYKRLKKQIGKGLEKYNEPVTPESYSVEGWLNHLKDELTDGLTYGEIISEKIEKVIFYLKMAGWSIEMKDKDEFITQAIEILVDHKKGNE